MSVRLYRVGGAVRDSFLRRPSKDIDYAVEAGSFDEMRDYILQEGGKIFLETPQYLTIRAHLNGDAADFVLCRKDGAYSDKRRPDSVEVGTIYDDLARRDFTMNAIAIRVEDGAVIDPHDGGKDLSENIIRCVGRTVDRFTEDPLRMLRAVRFHITLGMTLSTEIYHALHANHLLIAQIGTVSEERIKDELEKCLRYDTQKTVRFLGQCGYLCDLVFHPERNLWLKPTLEKR